jgi:ubiquinone/menaquinone biosynthesis C-methylase UbiE
MEAVRVLSHGQAARLYDTLGAGLDTQAFYEAAALHELVEHLDLGACRAVVEFGCGTGRLAAELLEAYLPDEAAYLGLDVSGTMVELAQRRLARWSGRAEVRKSDGLPHIDAANGAFDRFICTYVLDLLSAADIGGVLDEAHRVLRADGLLGAVSLTNGPTPTSRLVTRTWSRIHRMSPWLVGGCRPIALSTYLSRSGWTFDYSNTVVRFGIPSEVVVARHGSTARSSSN